MSERETIDLTPDEERAIRSLKRLAKKWPRSLTLFASGDLTVRKRTATGNYDASRIVASITGIPNDGGDGGDIFPQ